MTPAVRDAPTGKPKKGHTGSVTLPCREREMSTPQECQATATAVRHVVIAFIAKHAVRLS